MSFLFLYLLLAPDASTFGWDLFTGDFGDVNPPGTSLPINKYFAATCSATSSPKAELSKYSKINLSERVRGRDWWYLYSENCLYEKKFYFKALISSSLRSGCQNRIKSTYLSVSASFLVECMIDVSKMTASPFFQK